MTRPLRIGVSPGALSRHQTSRIQERLMRAGIASRQVEIAGGLEGAMLEDEIDFVVISLEEMDPRLPAGLTIAAINERTDSRDALVGRSGLRWASLPSGARIAAGGQGRLAQLLRARSDLEVVETRAPIEILLAGLDAYPDLSGVVVSVAALDIAGLTDVKRELLPTEFLLPAPGQGALAIIARSAEAEMMSAVQAALHRPRSAACVRAERGFLGRLWHGSEVPVAASAAWAEPAATADGWLELVGRVLSPDGQLMLEGVIAEPVHGEVEAERLGARLAQDLVEQGALELLAQS